MWHESCGKKSFVSLAEWPEFDPAKTIDSTVEVAVQISGKFKGTITLAAGLSKEDALASVKADERFAKQFEGKTIVKEISVPDKLVNLVVR